MRKYIALGHDKYTCISEEDFDRVSHYRCYLNRATGYVTIKIRYRSMPLHRFIMDAPKGLEIDHKNGDKLDNRRENLEIVTHAENCRRRRFQSKKSELEPDEIEYIISHMSWLELTIA